MSLSLKTDIKIYGKTQWWYRIYERVKTYQDLIETNIAFLNGEIKRTPYHDGSIEEETHKILDNLVKINKFGFFTTNSQPSLCEYRKYIPKLNYYIDVEQKSYISGFMFREEFYNLLSFIENNSLQVIYNITDIKKNILISNLKDNSYNVTRDRSYKQLKDQVNTHWRYYTSITKGIHYDEYDNFGEYQNIQTILRNNCVFVELCLTEYCRFEIADVLLEFYNSNK